MQNRPLPRLYRRICWSFLTACVLSVYCPAILSFEWEARSGYRVAPFTVSPSDKTGFTRLHASETGIAFTNTLSEAALNKNHNLLNGAGLAFGDYDGDGWCDIFIANIGGASALYRNLGQWKFEDVTATAGLAELQLPLTLARSAAMADVTGDGHLDLVLSFHNKGVRVFVNDGQGRFSDAAIKAMQSNAGAMSLALADIDGDGDLDVYLANYGENTIRSGLTVSTRMVNGQEEVVGRYRNRLKIYDGKLVEYGEPHALYINDGKGDFKPVSWVSGRFLDEDGQPLKTLQWDMGLSAMFRDINGDGYPDLFVCNDFQNPDRIWINDGKGNFRAPPREMLRISCNFSMGVDFADLNRDGLDDFFVVDMLSRYHPLRITQISPPMPSAQYTLEKTLDRPQVRRNMLYLNRGDGTYAEIGQSAGVHASDWSWCPVFLDVDLDGYEDLLVADGHVYDTQDLDVIKRNSERTGPNGQPVGSDLHEFPRLLTPNNAFRNRGDLTFEEVGKAWGFDATDVSHGIALADLDNDGDQDVMVNCLGTPVLVYRNENAKPRVAVRLKGKAPNVQGIGAKIRVIGGPVTQSQEMISGGRFLSSDDALRVFAAGSLTNELTIEVTWRNGTHSIVQGAKPNHIYEIDEAGAVAKPRTETPKVAPLFTELALTPPVMHHDDPHDDFAAQPLLPYRLSQLGPGVAWYDLDGDGWDDLTLGSGRGGVPTLLRNDGKGSFAPFTNAAATPVTRDQTGLVGWVGVDGKPKLLAGLANYEDGFASGPAVAEYDAVSAGNEVGIYAGESSTGPLAVADFDADGDLDLFVGGRVMPTRYPQAAASSLWRNQGGKLVPDKEHNARFGKLGLVSGAVLSDLSGDGWPELVLACEWGPVRVFLNERGKLREVTKDWGLDRFTGWWNGVSTGDFDGDGRLDIVASNWGSNTPYQGYRAKPMRLHFADFDGNSTVETVESWYAPDVQKWVTVRGYDAINRAMPFVQERFPTYAAYSKAGVPDIFRAEQSRWETLEVTTLESMVFLNRGNKFEARPLPLEAQLSPAFAVCVADADNDGHEDIFLSQNLFALEPETARYDSGRGLWLRGQGNGNFTALSGTASGVIVYEEQRGAAVSDFDGDGRVDLAVAQNSNALRVFRNTGGQVGLRVRVAGGAGNPHGVGTILRVKRSDGSLGPAREIHGGSGYWSQDGVVAVLAAGNGAAELSVQRPGQAAVIVALPASAKEVLVNAQSEVKPVR